MKTDATDTTAFAYDPASFQAGVLAGLEKAAKATCSCCGTAPTKIEGSRAWWHVSEKTRAICNAGPIHDMIAARKGTNAT